jgi:very-short-patch-repair endonuclease
MKGKQHSVESRMHMSEAAKRRDMSGRIGEVRSVEARQKMREAALRPERMSALLKRIVTRAESTGCERQLYALLESAYGCDGFKKQHPLGGSIADAYTPEDGIVWEADGAYWHSKSGSAERDRRRDDKLIQLDQVAAVVRLGEHELIKMGLSSW